VEAEVCFLYRLLHHLLAEGAYQLAARPLSYHRESFGLDLRAAAADACLLYGVAHREKSACPLVFQEEVRSHRSFFSQVLLYNLDLFHKNKGKNSVLNAFAKDIRTNQNNQVEFVIGKVSIIS